jgi:hypothetical protein
VQELGRCVLQHLLFDGKDLGIFWRQPTHPLARQKYWQIRTNFTLVLLYNYNLNLDYKDYS